MHSEVDQSLEDLNENMNTERALQKISLHVQKAADNVKNLPDVGEKLGTIIIGEAGLNSALRHSKSCILF